MSGSGVGGEGRSGFSGESDISVKEGDISVGEKRGGRRKIRKRRIARIRRRMRSRRSRIRRRRRRRRRSKGGVPIRG